MPLTAAGGRAAGDQAVDSWWRSPGDVRLELELEPSNSSITFFEGDGHAAAAWIHERVRKLVLERPWLAGRVHKPDGSDVIVRPPASKPEHARHVVELHRPALRPDQPYEDMWVHVQAGIVPSCAACLNKDEVLFKVGVVQQDETHFAVVVSLSRVIADGVMYYQVYEALGQPPPRQVGPITGPNSSALHREANIESQLEFMNWAKNLYWFGSHMRSDRYTSRRAINAWVVNSRWVAAVKREQAGGSKFSTHDILTSWFGQHGGYDHVVMATNRRERLPDEMELRSGSFEGYLYLWPHEFATPEGVKCAYHNHSVGFQAERDEATGMAVASSSSNVGAVLNGASHFSKLVLPACQQVLHLPAFDPTFHVDLMIMFWAMPNQLAVLIQSQRAATEWETTPSPLGARLFQENV